MLVFSYIVSAAYGEDNVMADGDFVGQYMHKPRWKRNQ